MVETPRLEGEGKIIPLPLTGGEGRVRGASRNVLLLKTALFLIF